MEHLYVDPRDEVAAFWSKRDIREQGRKRFTTAHEIGHYLLHKDADSLSCGAKEIANWTNLGANPEHEADEFASELLLPAAEMKTLIGTQMAFAPARQQCCRGVRRQLDRDDPQILRSCNSKLCRSLGSRFTS